MAARDFARGPSDYRRRKPRFERAGKTFLIVVEGAETERRYLDQLRLRLQLSAADIRIVHPEGTDPKTLVWEAVRLRSQRQREARKSPTLLPYDEVWVVFDLEKTHDERRQLAAAAIQSREAKSLLFAASDPAFEYWLLLHFTYTTKAFHDCAAVTKALKKHWPEFAKDATPTDAILDRLPDAVRHARRCRDHHAASGGERPFTDMDKLAVSLNQATRNHLRLLRD